MQIYLNDLGIINALGSNKNEVIQGLLNHKRDNLIPIGNLFTSQDTYVASVSDNLPIIDEQYLNHNTRNNQLLIGAYSQIQPCVEKLKCKYTKDRIGVVLGTSTSGIAEGELAFNEFMDNGQYPVDFNYQQQELGQIALFLSQHADLCGPSYAISTACSSSAKAIISGSRLIKSNICDVVIVGGCDSLCQMTVNGFDSLDSVSDKICNPFSQNRNGITIGEGAALFVLSKEPSDISLLGSGESSDGYHITSPHPDGLGAQLAMQQALDDANLKPHQIGYINAHGTATIKNDQMEAKAIYNVFGNYTPTTSTKPLTGHTLGAAAAIELGLCWLLLSEKYNSSKIIPKQIWDRKKGDDIADCQILMEPTEFTQKAFLSNSFAFGGNNTSLIIGKLDALK